MFAVFYLPIYFLENDSAWKNEKCFLFHLKSFLGCQDIPISIFSSSPFFPPVNCQPVLKEMVEVQSESLWDCQLKKQEFI